MNIIKLHDINMLYFLWIVPVLIGFLVYAGLMRKKALLIFIEAKIFDKIKISSSRNKRRWKAAFILTATIFIILGLTRPAWNPKPETIERRGRDVVFLLDVSKSMLAEDLVPNRLERAKLAIHDCVEQLQGDRVALVAFAGNAAVKCPLTLDYGFFKMMLNDISTESIARGGTMIGDAIRKVLNEVLDNQRKEFKDIILITDGEDHDSFPVEAAKKSRRTRCQNNCDWSGR
ncbi:MAG: hypothetical protein SCARUB_00893 [Candidatus Scalindua rubra]|uniref:VWFA domain-containing protein n=1 Tax=Candidatus Scalindua rubra TaxID=1872076 RepID=A0A1E3XEA9_9BACT|nr:MAG: hypothetical protein SCARUB_00893 [Candidatus Scalindua rubra]